MNDFSPLPSIPPLAITPFPAPGEHFASYVRRLAEANGFPSLHQLAAHLGLNHLVPRSAEPAWTHLGAATGFGPEHLGQLRVPLLGEGRHERVVVEGHEIHSTFVDWAHLRSCPACLEEDGHLPMRFAVRHVAACVRHGLLLSDECVCGKSRKAYQAASIWRCPACGLHPTELPRLPADTGELLVARLLFPAGDIEIPHGLEELRMETLAARVAVVERLGRLALTAATDAPSDARQAAGAKQPDGATPARRLRDDRDVVEAAADLLTHWPDRYHALLGTLVDRHVNPAATPKLLARFSTRAGHLAVRSFVDHDRRIVPFAENVRLAFFSQVLGLTRHSNLVERRSARYHRMPGEPRKTVETPRTDANFVTAFELGRRLHLGDLANIHPWFEAGLISTVRHVDGSLLVQRSDFESMMDRVHSLSEGDGDLDEYVPAAEMIKRRSLAYRSRYLIEDVLEGAIRSRAANDGSEGMRSRLLHGGDFRRRSTLCRTAVLLIEDGFAPSSSIASLWSDRRMPPGSLASVRRSRKTVAARDLVRVIQASGTRIFVTDEATLNSLPQEKWRSILVDGLCARNGTK